ncbi:MAG: ElyC/SanA/YdcF family protein, partial [Patescibacteria group bacterium]|nr:ElyC/SanA/YdcF family protein [Patescibacteria group bacterium]
MKITRKLIFRLILASTIILTITFVTIPPALIYAGKYQIYREIQDIKPTQIGIVFGAGVKPDGTPHDMLEDRLLTAIELYNNETIEKIIVSGDNSTEHYNEPEAMQNFLSKNGIPDEDIIPDLHGVRTYDTCYRAKKTFGVDKAILISQGYHLPRAIYLCNHFGIDSTGYSATKRSYENKLHYEIREVLALYRSVLD